MNSTTVKKYGKMSSAPFFLAFIVTTILSAMLTHDSSILANVGQGADVNELQDLYFHFQNETAVDWINLFVWFGMVGALVTGLFIRVWRYLYARDRTRNVRETQSV